MDILSGLTWPEMVAKVLGAIVIFVVSIMKVPQIHSVLKNQSSKGLDLRSLLFEVAGFSVFAAYGFNTKIPLSAYGEVYLLLIQDVILLWLILYYNKMFNSMVMILHGLYVLYALVVAFDYLPERVLLWLVMVNMPGSYIGIILQIRTIRQAKSSGTLAPLTFFLGLFCIAVVLGIYYSYDYLSRLSQRARVYTTAIETDDKLLLYNASLMVLMNIVLCYYVVKYRDTDSKQV